MICNKYNVKTISYVHVFYIVMDTHTPAYMTPYEHTGGTLQDIWLLSTQEKC